MTYVFVVFLARFMSVDDFGYIGAVFSASLLLSVFASFGQQQALVRYIPALRNDQNTSGIHAFVAQSLKVVTISNLVMWACLCIGLFAASAANLVDNVSVLALGLLIVPLTAFVDFLAYLVRAHKGVLLAVMPKDILWRLISLAILAVVFFSNGRQDLPLTFVFGVLVAVLALIIVTTALLAPTLYGTPTIYQILKRQTGEFDRSEWSKSNIPFSVTSVASVVFASVDVVIVAILLGPGIAGLYFAANRIAQAPGFFQQSYNVVSGPIFAEHAATGDHDALAVAAQNATAFTFIPTIVTCAILAFFAEPILSLFGPDFVAVRPTLFVLLATALANVFFGQSDLLLTMCKLEKSAMKISLWSTILGVIFIVTGAILADELGAAIGTFVSVVIRKVWFWRVATQQLNIWCDVISTVETVFKKERNSGRAN
ncbi:oligosaccharide flippase family protein [Rhodobacteraceae bacterium CY05]|uniref:Oligosaccharide flippase family protein n=2 Tax=Parasedimentitalea huanghaiensis TaxID=2682100 RepID=A0A6L6WLA1_9RHOB|nr:oligosaccharide flippase family protein [Zongyanglinia huanghaiensis]